MREDSLSVQLVSLNGSAFAAVSGEIDMATTAGLRAALVQMQSNGVPVLLDMSKVTFMDSSGLHVLIDASIDGPNPVRIVEASDQVRRVLEIAGVTWLLGTAEDYVAGRAS